MSVTASELKQKTAETFDRYIKLTEQRVASEVAKPDSFLWVDSLPEPRRAQVYTQLTNGGIVIERLHTLDSGQEIRDDDSLIHHWVAVVYVPGVKLADALRLIQDYDHHAEIFNPDVARSKILSHNGNDFRTSVRFVKKKVITVVLDTEHEIRYTPLDGQRVHMRAVATQIVEVDNPGKSDERLLPPGKDGGYMWRLNTYWRFQERDGGVYVQCESVTLTRDIPTGLGWIVGPFVKSIPRESLEFTLGTTRRVLLEHVK